MRTITKVKCLIPFTNFLITHHGDCFSCCPAWTSASFLGKLNGTNSIMDLWNSKSNQRIREAVLSDNLGKICNFKLCPYAIHNQEIDLINYKTDDNNVQAIIEQIKMGKTILETPPYLLESAYSPKCNLKCIMCHSHDGFSSEDKVLDEIIFKKKIPEILSGISKLRMAGGEPLVSKNTREFLQNLNPALYPSLKISFITNGLLFTPKLWETIKHNNYDEISVSVDAASKTTYEYIRKNGNWDILRRNLDFIASLRKELRFKNFMMSFTVMKSNYKEMKDFIKLGSQLGCDFMYFQKIFGYADTRENIDFINNKRILKEIASILEDPVFLQYNVGTTIVESYKKYTGSNPSFFNDFISTLKGSFFYHPARLIYKYSKVRSKIESFLKKNE